IPDRARADLPEAEVGVAVARGEAACGRGRPGGAGDEPGAQQRLRIGVVGVLLVTAIDRGAPLVVPVMLEAGRDAPGCGELELASDRTEDRIGGKAEADVGAAVAHEAALALAHIGGGADAVHELRPERVS